MATALARGRGSVPYAELVVAGQRVLLLHLRGELERVSELLLDLTPRFEVGLGGTAALTRAVQVASLLWLGHRADAERHYEALAASDFAEVERDENWLLTLQIVAEVAAELGDRRRGQRLYAALEPHADLLVSHDLVRVATGSVEAVLGRLALLDGRVDASIAHYERGAERCRRAGLAPALGLAQVGLARALFEHGRRGDAERARGILAELLAGAPSLARRQAVELRERTPKAS
jgi:hypothetical protein